MSAPDPLRLRADPLADATISAALAGCADEAALWTRVALLNREFARWDSNAALASWQPATPLPPEAVAALQHYLASASQLPSWADPAAIERAETLFYEMSMMSCTLLFCASLPQCYVVPDLAAVLHAAGQLEAHTDYRIRMTAAMIFPVMLKGGLCTPQGAGLAQALKVRLIHAMIRHLVLRGAPEAAPATLAPLASASAPASLHQALYAHGWDTARDGLPVNQEELAYTLLTFHYIFLAGLRKLGIGFAPADEQAYLHTWNVLGHVIGIDDALLPHSVDAAAAQFARLQASGRAHPYAPDPRPALGQALMAAMADVIPLRVLKPVPVLMTRYLCGPQVAAELGLDQQVGLLPRLLFALGMGLTRAIDSLVRLLLPQFSLTRMFSRALGYHFTTRLLLDQTRPLQLPTALLNQVGATAAGWGSDPKAPAWVNALERRMTGRAAPPPKESRA
ncbi:oxygenase MpaB family protein [Massilia sp. TS11]|uniref:oxygenase MpaB family protein n=1 Tax=Massilia sp. TS11 TaxID=2908003 RepID=UPI001EDBC3FD|nr:oxygenase MpaB family protein [Massilia sp. TS11]MCG2583601.1 DUF2236 domain-containing protein [Massilia sp. TS11]